MGNPQSLKGLALPAFLPQHLKPHQKEGFQFIWNALELDFRQVGVHKSLPRARFSAICLAVCSVQGFLHHVARPPVPPLQSPDIAAGCILAHHMGLGKASACPADVLYVLESPPCWAVAPPPA